MVVAVCAPVRTQTLKDCHSPFSFYGFERSKSRSVSVSAHMVMLQDSVLSPRARKQQQQQCALRNPPNPLGVSDDTIVFLLSLCDLGAAAVEPPQPSQAFGWGSQQQRRSSVAFRTLMRSFGHSFALRADGGGLESVGDRGIEFRCWGLVPMFNDRRIEGAFVHFMMSSWKSRIALALLSTLVALSKPLIFIAPSTTVSVVLYYVFLFCMICGAGIFAHLWRQSTTLLRAGSLFSSSSLVQPDPRAVMNSRIGEVVSLILFFGGSVLLTVSLFYGKLLCRGEPYPLNYLHCHRIFGLESLTMVLQLAVVLIAPMRLALVAAGVTAAVAAFVAMSVALPFADDSRKRFYTTLPFMVLQSVSCVGFSRVTELALRRSFIVATALEQLSQQLSELRKLAHFAASRHIPKHVLDHFSGERHSIECHGICCVFALTQLPAWAEGRSPLDVIRVLTFIFRGADAALNLMSKELKDVCVTRINALGDQLVLAFHSDKAANSRTCPALPDIVWPYLQLALHNLERQCLQLDDPRCAASLQLASYVEKASRRVVLRSSLFPTLAVCKGTFRLHTVPTAAAMLASGAVVDECLRNSQLLVNGDLAKVEAAASDAPNVWVAENVFASCETTASDPLPFMYDSNTGTLAQVARAGYGASSDSRSLHTLQRLSNSRSATLDTSVGVMELEPSTAASKRRSLSPLTGPSQKATFLETRAMSENHQAKQIRIDEDTFDEQCYRRDLCSSRETKSTLQSAAVFMVLFGAAMLATCPVYGTWEFAWNAPLPYICGELCFAAALFALTAVHGRGIPPVGFCEAMYFGFSGCVMLSSFVMPPSSVSIIGFTTLPWSLVVVTLTLQRPLWYSAAWMWILELIVSLLVFTKSFFRPDDDATVLLEAFAGLFLMCVLFVLRRLLDRDQLERYAAERSMERDARRLREESQRLLHTLQKMAPLEESQRILLARRERRERRVDVGIQPAATLAAFQGTAIATAVEDRAFAVVNLCLRHSTRHQASVDGLVASVRECLVQPVTGTPAHSDVASPVVLTKFCGEVLMLSATTAKHRNRRDAVVCVIDAVRRLQFALRNDSNGFRAWIGWAPVVGALLGEYSPTFEWYAPQVLTGCALVRSDAASGVFHKQTGSVYLSDAAVYGLSDAEMNAMCSPRQVWCFRGIGRVGAYRLLTDPIVSK